MAAAAAEDDATESAAPAAEAQADTAEAEAATAALAALAVATAAVMALIASGGTPATTAAEAHNKKQQGSKQHCSSFNNVWSSSICSDVKGSNSSRIIRRSKSRNGG